MARRETRKLSALWIVGSAFIIMALALFSSGLMSSVNHASETTLLPTELQWLKTHPIVTVAPDMGYAPIEFYEEGQFKGIAVDYLNWMENHYPIKFKLVQFTTWSDVMDAVRNQRVDMLSSAAQTPERSGYLHFTKAYVSTPSIILRRIDQPGITNEEKFVGLKVGVMKGYAVEEFLKIRYPNLKIAFYDAIDQGLKDVVTGKLDAIVVESTQASYYISKLRLTNLMIEDQYQVDFPINLAMAARKDAPELANILNKMIESMPLSEKQAIDQKWMGVQGKWGVSKVFFYTLLAAFCLVSLVAFLVIFWNRTLTTRVRGKTKELESLNAELEKKVERRTKLLSETNHQLELSMYNLQIKESELLNLNAELEASVLDLQISQKRLVEAEKVASLGRLVASVAHEMNTPLGNAIMMTSFMEEQRKVIKVHILENSSDDIKLMDYVDTVEASSELLMSGLARVSHLVSRFKELAVQNLNQGKIIFNLEELFEACIQRYSQIKKVKTSVVFEDLGGIFGICAAYEEILCNLISNSIVHGFPSDFDGVPEIHIKMMRMDDGLEIQYWDNGIGVSDELLEKIKEPLFSTNRSDGNLGIGLNIIMNLLSHTLKGEMYLENQIEQGLKVTLKIPQVDWQ